MIADPASLAFTDLPAPSAQGYRLTAPPSAGIDRSVPGDAVRCEPGVVITPQEDK